MVFFSVVGIALKYSALLTRAALELDRKTYLGITANMSSSP